MQSKLQPLESTTELPIEQLYNQTVEAFKADFTELARSGEKLPSLDSALRDMGVECDNDMSFFVMGAVGKAGVDLAGQSLGLAAHSKLGMAADIGSTAYGMADESRREKTTFKRAPENKKPGATSKSAFSRFAAPKTVQAAPRKAASSLLFATSMMNAKKKAQKPALSADKRAKLKQQLESHRRIIGELTAMKSCGYKYARRVTMLDQNGQRQTMLIPSEANAKMAFSPKSRRHEQAEAAPQQDNTPARRPAAMTMTLAA